MIVKFNHVGEFLEELKICADLRMKTFGKTNNTLIVRINRQYKGTGSVSVVASFINERNQIVKLEFDCDGKATPIGQKHVSEVIIEKIKSYCESLESLGVETRPGIYDN